MGLLSKTSDVATAEAALADAEATVARWEAEATAAGAEHASLLERSGDEVIADPDSSGRIADLLTRLSSRQVLAANAVTAAVRRVEVAQRAVLSARAVEVRARAARLRTTAAVRQRKTDRLLADLKAHEGCDYLPFRPERAPGQITTVIVPWTTIASQTAAALDAQAAELEQVAADGSAEQVAGAVGRPVPEPRPVEDLRAEGFLVAS